MSEVRLTTVRLPTSATLKKYGLSVMDYVELWDSQNGCCAVCHRPFEEGRKANIDHVHVPRWKKMKPSERRQYVRGLLCYQHNKFSAMRGMTPGIAWNLWMYLNNFEVRIRSGNLDTRQQVVKRRNVRHSNQQQDEKDRAR